MFSAETWMHNSCGRLICRGAPEDTHCSIYRLRVASRESRQRWIWKGSKEREKRKWCC